jgi:hypothetical protein
LEIGKVNEQQMNQKVQLLQQDHLSEVAKLTNEHESRLLIEKSRFEYMEKRLKESYDQQTSDLTQSIEIMQKNYQKQVALLENKINDLKVELKNSQDTCQHVTDVSEKDRLKFQYEITQMTNSLHQQEKDRLNYEYYLASTQELSALIISLYREGRLRTTDEYDSNELLSYLTRYSTDKRGKEDRGERKERKREKKGKRTPYQDEENKDLNRRGGQRGLDGVGLHPNEQEMIVPLLDLQKAYELSKVKFGVDSIDRFRKS